MQIGDAVYVEDSLFLVNHIMEADVILYTFLALDPRFQNGQFIMVPKSSLVQVDEAGIYSIDGIVEFQIMEGF